MTGPALTEDTTIFWEQGILDVLFEYPIQSDRSHFCDPHGASTRLGISVVTALRFLPPGGVVRALTSSKATPASCRSIRAGTRRCCRFVTLGFFHILDGTDHLLFLFCLVIPFRRIWTLVPIVTAFTVAHSITLIASAYNYAPGALWFPPLIETLIATSIVYMALENIVGRDAAAALDDHVPLRPRPRLRLLVRPAAHDAVRRLAPADVAALVQRRRRARPAAGARR